MIYHFNNMQDKIYTYDNDSKVTISGKDFELIRVALAHGIESTVERHFIEKSMFVNTENGKEVKSPTTKQIAEGRVTEAIDVDSTFKSAQISYNSKLTPIMWRANAIANSIHADNIEKGVATPLKELSEEPAEQE